MTTVEARVDGNLVCSGEFENDNRAEYYVGILIMFSTKQWTRNGNTWTFECCELRMI